MYDELKKQGKSFVMVFCSHDRDEKSAVQYFEDSMHREWLMIPFDEFDARTLLKDALLTSTVPQLTIIDLKTQEIIQNNVLLKGFNPVLFPWRDGVASIVPKFTSLHLQSSKPFIVLIGTIGLQQFLAHYSSTMKRLDELVVHDQDETLRRLIPAVAVDTSVVLLQVETKTSAWMCQYRATEWISFDQFIAAYKAGTLSKETISS